MAGAAALLVAVAGALVVVAEFEAEPVVGAALGRAIVDFVTAGRNPPEFLGSALVRRTGPG